MPVTNYIWDVVSDNVLMEKDDDDETIARYVQEPSLYGEAISQERGGDTRYYHYDGEGNTIDLTDENENVTDTYEYTAFGEEVARTGSTVNPFGYKGSLGYYTNTDTDDTYVRARTYEPKIGRWMSPDPLLLLGYPSTYLYADNTPVVLQDPSGLISFAPIIGIPAALPVIFPSLTVLPQNPGCTGCGEWNVDWNITPMRNRRLILVQKMCHYGIMVPCGDQCGCRAFMPAGGIQMYGDCVFELLGFSEVLRGGLTDVWQMDTFNGDRDCSSWGWHVRFATIHGYSNPQVVVRDAGGNRYPWIRQPSPFTHPFGNPARPPIGIDIGIHLDDENEPAFWQKIPADEWGFTMVTMSWDCCPKPENGPVGGMVYASNSAAGIIPCN